MYGAMVTRVAMLIPPFEGSEAVIQSTPWQAHCPKEIPGKILLCALRQQYQATSGSLLALCIFCTYYHNTSKIRDILCLLLT